MILKAQLYDNDLKPLEDSKNGKIELPASFILDGSSKKFGKFLIVLERNVDKEIAKKIREILS